MVMTLDTYLDKNKQIFVVKDSKECLELLRQYHSEGYFFRGLGDKDYKLETTLDRIGLKNLHLKWQGERWLIREFKRRIHHYLSIESIPKTTFELLALMQHYGVPTRLLDFTKSPFVALYFAVRDVLADKDAAVWAFEWFNLVHRSIDRIGEQDKSLGETLRKLRNPANAFTKDALFEQWIMPKIMDASDGAVHAIIDHDIVMNLEPLRMNKRLTVQQGLFFVSGSAMNTFEETLVDLLEVSQRNVAPYPEPSVVKIVIPQKLRLPLMKELELMNINAASLFEGLDGFAASLKEKIPTMDDDSIAQTLWVAND